MGSFLVVTYELHFPFMWFTAKHISNFQYPKRKRKTYFIDVDCGMYIL
jgi:hypothetical protein